MSDFVLACDVGNTETKLGVFHEGRCVQTWRLRTERHRTADEYVVVIGHLFSVTSLAVTHVRQIVVASVVPAVDAQLVEAAKRLFGREPCFFRPSEQRLMEIDTERPGEVGADLIAAAYAARERRGAPVIVITFGTATAYAAVNRRGAYAGVAIAPGMHIALDALIDRAAKLPQIALAAPEHAIGRTTVAALQSGVLYGAVAQTEGMVARFRNELGYAAPVVASGGFADIIAAQTTVIDDVVPTLVLEGLVVASRREGGFSGVSDRV